MSNAAEKTTGPFGRERKQVRTFASSQSMHEFLNGPKGYGWSEHKLGLKSGVYAYAGGRWWNVRKLDALQLAHI